MRMLTIMSDLDQCVGVGGGEIFRMCSNPSRFSRLGSHQKSVVVGRYHFSNKRKSLQKAKFTGLIRDFQSQSIDSKILFFGVGYNV